MSIQCQRQRQRQLFNANKDKNKRNSSQTMKYDNTYLDPEVIYPGGHTALKLLLSVRLCSAIWSYISDCDETFNYWEPSHYLLYGQGQQTWEYSPIYALRSYTYLLMHVVPAKLYCHIFEPNPVSVFYFIRCLLSVGCALSEAYFYRSVCREFGIHIGRLTLVFLLTSSGMFISSAAFLPSSFSMYMSTVATAAWFDRKYELAIFTTAISSLLGWPFVALLGVPIAIDMLVRRKQWRKLMKWSIISAIVILAPMTWIDSMYYGKFTIAPLNLIHYNVFTNHGPDIFGTAPFSFYLINGFLNFNFIFIGALITPIVLLLTWGVVPSILRKKNCLPYWYTLGPLYLWLIVMFLQPHKEERFLFPIYPMICMAGAITVDRMQRSYFYIKRQFNHLSQSANYLEGTSYIMFLALTVFVILGISRSFALFNGYNAPIEVMMEANRFGMEHQVPSDVNINFCVGKEWHRFPGSFFFPTKSWKLEYLQSEFKGQLPQAFSFEANATRIVQSHFNDLNKEEPSRYFDVEKCHFILDLDLGTESELEPNYSRDREHFTIIKSYKFLDSSMSHPFFRAFYIPTLSNNYCKYASYNLLKNNKLKLF